jgi:hypothetical protein
MKIRRYVGVLAASAGLALSATPAFAQTVSSASATGIVATGIVPIARTPAADCPGNGGPLSRVGVDLTGQGVPVAVGVLNAQCAIEDGTNTASASAADVNINNGALHVSALSSSCSNGVNGPTGDASLVDINGNPIAAPPNTVLPAANPLLTIFLNEQKTDAAGNFTVNAIRVSLAPGTQAAEEVIIGQSRCAPGTPVIPESRLAIMLPFTALAVFGLGAVLMRRRAARAAA